uniref:Cyclic nucleotide-binding domain-containing protein n=1 Tax=Phytophthora fragariae TaxID=53985 RepID=A0A6A3FBD7_9STRA|nr:hypothetical protein PF009_g7431 [Phytophthora fragariae]
MWEQSLLLCLLLEAFLLPYLLAFQPEVVGGISMFFVFIIACEFVFTVDIYVQARMGYYSDGNLIRDKKRTIRRYIRSWHFALDVIAIVPVQILVIGFPRVVAKLLFVKLLRWSRLPHLVSSLDEFYAKQFVVLKLLKVLASTLYLAHVLACIRYSFGEDTSQNNPWLPASSLHHLPLHRHYLAALFWSVGIMTGLFEGELPRHNAEFLFTILVALCGFSMFTTLCATIFVISKCESGNTEAVGARINQLVHVLSFHHVPENQQTQAIDYLKRYYTDAESTDRETAKILCPSIANDIQVELLKATIAEVSIFGGCSDQFIVAMTSLLEMIAVPAQTTLFTVGDHGNAMYVVHSGVLAIIVKSVTVREIRKGACFGELYVFSKLPCMATITTTTYAILYKLSRFHCERVLEGYPDCASVIAVHVRAMFKLLNISDDNLGSDVSTSISTPITPRKLTSRRTSVTAGKTALIGGPTLIKIPSRRDSKVMPSRRESITQKLSKATGAIGPLRRDISQWSKRTIVVDNVQKRFTASAFEQNQFIETSTRIQLFLRRQKVPLAIHHRVKSFLDYWWSSHRGAVIRELLADLPRSMRLELRRSICMPVLQTLALLQGVHSVRDKLEEILVENAEFILYGQGETVYRHGDYVTGMFFLLEGEVCVVKVGGPPSEVPRGGFFGIAALTQKERGEGYTEHVSANRGCILLFVSREQLQAMEAIFPALKTELLALDQRLLNNKLAGLNVNNYQEVDNQIEVPSRVFYTRSSLEAEI